MRVFVVAVLSGLSVLAAPALGVHLFNQDTPDLPKALGVTLGGPYEEVFRAYEAQGYDLSGIVLTFPSLPHQDQAVHKPVPRRALFFQATYDYTLVDLSGAEQVTYKVFKGKVMGFEVFFGLCSEMVVFDPDCKKKYDELSSMLDEKYGPSKEPRKLLEQIRSGFPKTWQKGDLEITLRIKSRVSLEYTCLPLKAEKDERDRQLDLEAL